MSQATVSKPRVQDDLARAMREAMRTIREWQDGNTTPGKAHRILYEALERNGQNLYVEPDSHP